MVTRNEDFMMVSVHPLWGWLIEQGYKKFEQRHKNLHPHKINKPVAIHITQRLGGTKKRRHGWYKLPVVRDSLSANEATQGIHDDDQALDDFFQQMTSSIIAIGHVVKTVRVTAANKDDMMAMYPFCGVGPLNGKTNQWGWIFEDVTKLSPPIRNVTGCLGMVALHKVKQAKRDLSELVACVANQYLMYCAEDHSDSDDEKNTEELDDDKHDMNEEDMNEHESGPGVMNLDDHRLNEGGHCVFGLDGFNGMCSNDNGLQVYPVNDNQKNDALGVNAVEEPEDDDDPDDGYRDSDNDVLNHDPPMPQAAPLDNEITHDLDLPPVVNVIQHHSGNSLNNNNRFVGLWLWLTIEILFLCIVCLPQSRGGCCRCK